MDRVSLRSTAMRACAAACTPTPANGPTLLKLQPTWGPAARQYPCAPRNSVNQAPPPASSRPPPPRPAGWPAPDACMRPRAHTGGHSRGRVAAAGGGHPLYRGRHALPHRLRHPGKCSIRPRGRAGAQPELPSPCTTRSSGRVRTQPAPLCHKRRAVSWPGWLLRRRTSSAPARWLLCALPEDKAPPHETPHTGLHKRGAGRDL
jgi:hypothetical protein